jgi:uncharacterized LabA/DUF88 family protein
LRVNVYVDGFNLYHRALEDHREPDGTTHKWLNLRALAERLRPSDEIRHIRFFTARVKPPIGGIDGPNRQQVYWRALRTLPGLSIHEGFFLISKKTARLVTPMAHGSPYVEVYKVEEKGSDANLASYLMLDAAQNDFDGAVVITNDSDFVTPVRLAKRELKKAVWVFDPCQDPSRVSRELKSVATRYHRIDRVDIAASLFPNELRDAVGTIRKPPAW